MKTLILATLTLFAVNVSAQKVNLDKLSEKERNEYLLKVAKETMLTYGPEWYKDNEEPVITSVIMGKGQDEGNFVYSITWFNNPQKIVNGMNIPYRLGFMPIRVQ